MGTSAKQIGIYKITSPSGKIYIGQSWDIKNRFRKYKSVVSIKKQRILYNSILKYGYINHTFEILKTFSEEVTQEELDRAEIYYIEHYKESGFTLLNIREGGSGGKLPKEAIEKMLTTRGKWNHTEETKKKISESHKGIGHSVETRNRLSIIHKGEIFKEKISELIENNRKIILDTELGIFYKGVKEASRAYGLSPDQLTGRLIGRVKNNTNLIYC